MTVWQLILHLFNFVLPALAMALLMPWAGRWVMGVGGRWRQHMLWHFLVGVGVLTLGLVLQGNDGTMATYAALVLVAATLEWVLLRAWAQRNNS
jgi:hypothetical protein